MTEFQVKSDLFKDVKYYVTGQIDPEVKKFIINDNNNNKFGKFICI